MAVRAVFPPCTICGSSQVRQRFSMTSEGTENGVSADAFRPRANLYGTSLGTVTRCGQCGHGIVLPPPSPEAVVAAYAAGADPQSLREEDGQVETARRALQRIEEFRKPGRLCDLGCWTGSFLVAARERGWETVGVEPSRWASAQARQRDLTVLTGRIGDQRVETASCDVVVLCDVLEHVADPREVLVEVRRILQPEGTVWIAVPDAGSRLARLMGRHWWSVLPMHLHYFTRTSLNRLLQEQEFSIVWTGTHAKVFSTRYYAERLSGYSTALARGVTSALRRFRLSDRTIAPDFRDRVAVLAVRRQG